MFVEKRRAKRFPARIGLVFKDQEGLNFSFITSISRYGLYIETERVLRTSSKISFVLSNSMSRAPVEGEVVRVKEAVFEGPPSGMGVEFLNMDQMAKMIRDDILLYLMNFEYQQIWAGSRASAV